MINVLLAEDDEGDAFLLMDVMRKTKFENTVHHCKDGMEAQEFLEDLQSPKPNFILLDLNMPRMDGHELLKWIKSHDELKHIPVGILTTSSSKDDINEAYKNYANYYITKPTTLADLQDIVNLIDDFWFRIAKLPQYE